MEKVQEYIDWFVDWAVVFTPKLFLAIAVLVIGFWMVKRVHKIIAISLDKANIGPEMATFLGSILEIILKFAILLVAAGMIGFEVSSLVAILAAAGFAVGLALQGFLGNFASGITIVFFKPYRVGDWVEIADKFGQVESIEIFNTTLITPGQKTLIIPNGQVTDNTIVNFSTRGHIRLELQVTMPYEESFPKVRKIILEALKDIPQILPDPAPIVGIETYDSHSIIVGVRPFVRPDDFWEVTFLAHEYIKKAFNENHIQVAYSEGVELGKIGD